MNHPAALPHPVTLPGNSPCGFELLDSHCVAVLPFPGSLAVEALMNGCGEPDTFTPACPAKPTQAKPLFRCRKSLLFYVLSVIHLTALVKHNEAAVNVS
jgi:hypothetical protein